MTTTGDVTGAPSGIWGDPGGAGARDRTHSPRHDKARAALRDAARASVLGGYAGASITQQRPVPC